MFVDGTPVGRLSHDGDAWRIDPLDPIDPIDPASAGRGICRCGASSRMPYCDREPPYGCFEEADPGGPEPAPFRWDVPDPSRPGVALKPDGPVRVAGGIEVRYDDGDPIPQRDRVSLCRCGASRCQPLCDSSHKVVGYRG